jgi:hypothetical protein
VLDVLESLTYHTQIGSARDRELNRAPATHKQFSTYLEFEQADLLTDGGLADAQALGGG